MSEEPSYSETDVLTYSPPPPRRCHFRDFFMTAIRRLTQLLDLCVLLFVLKPKGSTSLSTMTVPLFLLIYRYYILYLCALAACNSNGSAAKSPDDLVIIAGINGESRDQSPATASPCPTLPAAAAAAAAPATVYDLAGGNNRRQHHHTTHQPTPRPINVKGYSGKNHNHNNNDHLDQGDGHGHAYEKDGKYWLVPPFLIGASSIVVIYVFIHCLYTHCGCSDKPQHRRVPPGTVPIRRVQISGPGGGPAGLGGKGPTILLSDPGGSGAGGPGNRLVPMVCYDDAGENGTSGGGRTQTLVEAQPFLIYERCDDSLDYYDEPPTPRKGSGLLQLPAAIGRRLSQARLSFSSIGRGSTGSGCGDRSREPRASLCFIPVTRAVSDPSGVPASGTEINGSCSGNQPRFETFYCRTCGCANVIDIGSMAASAVPTSKPSGGNSNDIVLDAVTITSPTQLPTLPVPTILVIDGDVGGNNDEVNDVLDDDKDSGATKDRRNPPSSGSLCDRHDGEEGNQEDRCKTNCSNVEASVIDISNKTEEDLSI